MVELARARPRRSSRLRVRCLLALGVATAALVLADPALAHTGKTAPVATNFEARIGGVRPETAAVEAKVVDGDAGLWLHVGAGATLVIRGAEGEPMLLFDRHGVFANVRSLTAESDRIDLLDARPDPNPSAQPEWHRLTSGHSYLWHEHRLHVLEPLSRGHRATTMLGTWTVPFLLDGASHRLAGTLVYHRPGRVWPWIVLAVGLAATLAAAARLDPFERGRIARGAAVPTVLVVWTLRVGRELYGRPAVGSSGYLETALTCLVGVGLLYGLLHRDLAVRTVTALFAGIGSLYQGFTMLPVLTHAVALTTLPSPIARLGVAATLGLGAGISAIALREQFGATEPQRPRARDADARSRNGPTGPRPRSRRRASA